MFQVFRGAAGVADAVGPNVVAFGKFDGVHLGHRALLARAAAAARRLGLPFGAVTFDRHPYTYLRRGAVPPVLTGLADKLRLLRDAGARFVVLLPADATVLGTPAPSFVRDALRASMGVRVVVVGRNFRFGQGGAGGVLTLRELSSVAGIDGVEVGTVEVAGGPVSATRIRASLGDGDVELARDLLGRPYEVFGVARGSGVAVSPARAVPASGRYLGSVRWRGAGAPVAATVEVDRHLLTVHSDVPADRPVYVVFDKHVAFEKLVPARAG